MSSVVVVGAGVVGASVTYHLACLGVPVTLIDSAPAPAGGVTRESFGWIGDSGGDWPGGAEDLRSFVLGDHRRVEAQVPGVPIRWTGSLRWPDSVRRRRNGAGAPRRRVGRDEIRAIEPHLRTVPGRAVYSPGDAAVDPVRMTHALVRAAGDRGAQVVLGAGATALRVTHGQARGVLSARGFHPAATIVLAAGTGTTALAGELGVPLSVTASPAFLMRVAAPAGLIRTIVATPDFEAREVSPGWLVVTAPYRDGTPAGGGQRLAAQTLDRLRSAFRGSGALRLLGWAVAERPMPADGPILGYLTPDRGVYVAVMHSAVTLAPTAGRLVAQELATGQDTAELRRCRPAV